MSTKIYTAYRTKPGIDLWALVRELRLEAEKRAKAALWTLYPTLDERPGAAFHKMRCEYEKQLTQATRNEWDLSVSIAIWRSGSRYLLIPFAGSGHLAHALDFMKKRTDLEDYSYWNSSDRPADVTAQAWEARKRAWNRILDADSGWDDHLSLSIVSYDGFHRVNPMYAPEYQARLRRFTNE